MIDDKEVRVRVTLWIPGNVSLAISKHAKEQGITQSALIKNTLRKKFVPKAKRNKKNG